jgi:predicted ATPase
MRDDLPAGTVTFLFTDVEGSTKLLHELGAEAYADALADHRRVVREACAAEHGVEVDTQGDAFFFAFPSAPEAVAAAQAITDALAEGQIRLRIGVHTGTPLLTEEGYVGDDVHFAARVGASAHGGQVVLSQSTRELVAGAAVTELGEHRLKDIDGAVSIYQLGDGTFPPLKTISNTNLPRPASSFVGRERELSEVLASLERGARLLTLTGPGGSGKTRLALEVAATLVPSYKAGVFWIGLASLREASLVTDTIAQTLGAKDNLAEYIAEREMLLLLDNLEQVIEAAPALSGLVQACPNLTLFCTSRELLRVHGEVEYSVPPLASSEAVSLFCERSGLGPSEEVSEVCARLDDLPLAVELAAARTKALSPAQILERLSDRLDLLRGGRDAETRQQTLRATIAWSYDLLTEEEQRVFLALSVFVGGCTLEAVENVAEADLDTLQSLVEKSLLRFTSERYWTLETIREFAADQLALTSGAERLARRHLAYYFALAVDVDEHRKVGDYDLERLEEEFDNLRGALDTALMLDPEQALDLAGRLGLYWNRRGLYSEGRQRLAAALAAAPAAQPFARARALSEAGNLALWQADLDAAEQLGREALALTREHGDRSGSGYALNLLGMIATDRDPSAAVELYEESLAEYEAAGDEKGRLLPLQNLASNALSRRDYERAISLLRERVAGTRGRDTYSLALAIGLLGFALAANGETEEARQSFEESLELCRAHGFSRAEAEVLSGLADLVRTTNPSRALEYYRESIELAWKMGYLAQVAECLKAIAAIALAGGNARDAATLLGVCAGLVERIFTNLSPEDQEEIDAAVAQARGALENDAFDAAWAVGCGLSVDEAVEFALGVRAIECGPWVSRSKRRR